jgi:tRNA pseudouridine38-40 synthase
VSESRSIALTIAYDGARFAGFARQQGQRTVQGELEAALEVLSSVPVETVGAGRTDAGVHAIGQVVSCAIEATLVDDVERLIRSLNALTPSDIAVRALRVVDASFNARFDALSRTYLYRIANTPTPALFLAPYSWHIAQPLNRDAMAQAAHHLIGEHDFASFCVAKSAQELRGKNLSTSRRIDEITLSSDEVLNERMLEIRVRGNAFLHSMVRVIVGTLVEVGSGARDPDWVEEVLAACDRTCAGPTAPAHGLTLLEVRYPDSVGLWAEDCDSGSRGIDISDDVAHTSAHDLSISRYE